MAATAPRTIVKSYGRGSLLAFIGPLYAGLMARLGMRGWQDAAIRAMQDDAVAMARRGYRVASTEEHEIPALGVAWYRVTYEATD